MSDIVDHGELMANFGLSLCCRLGEPNDCVLEGMTSSIPVGPLAVTKAEDDIVDDPSS